MRETTRAHARGNFAGPLRRMTVVMLLVFNGCFLAPAIDSFQKIGVTSGDRQALLQDKVKKFQEAMFWGNRGEALKFVAQDSEPALRKELERPPKEERIVESKVERVDFNEDAHEASVEIRVRYFKVPVYVVTDRVESQGWVFSIADGWQIRSRSLTDAG